MISPRSFAAAAIIVSILNLASSVLTQPVRPVYFEDFLTKRFKEKKKWKFEDFCAVESSAVARRVLESYGSMFAAEKGVNLPKVCIYGGEKDVTEFQAKLKTENLEIDGVKIELQKVAADALESALSEAAEKRLRITPLDGAIAGRRSYGDTLMLWNSRFFPALEFWTDRKRISAAERDALAKLDLQKRVEKVLEWESKGMYFGTGRRRSIFSSTAPPGSSQHLALTAFDVVEYSKPNVRTILNRNGWYQTVLDDPPHFTYLGIVEHELPAQGLRSVAKGGFVYWIPNLQPRS